MNVDEQVPDLLERAVAGDRGALARLITMVERGGPGAAAVSAVTWPLAGSAHVVGLTGAPGAGKSTLTNVLCSELRQRDQTVGVLAVDPTSPFTGGAILGDRIRMGDHMADEGVYIRSMATRGNLGGLALATPEAVRVLDAVGYDTVVVETVGVGQAEVQVAGAADTTVVVVNPGWGDEVQAAKAGLLEVADVFVINKADREGTDKTRRELDSMLNMRPGEPVRRPPVVTMVATEGQGVKDLADAMEEHLEWLDRSGEGEQRRDLRARDELHSVLTAELHRRADAMVGGERWDAALLDVLERRSDPWQAAAGLLDGP